MQTIGILGGMSWESTAVYYRRLNDLVREAQGGISSAKVLLHSFDFLEIERLQHAEDWDALGQMLSLAASGLRRAGADFLLIATNTMHLVADTVAAGAQIDLLHIADAAGEAVAARGLNTVALLGTRFTMERSFCADRLASHYGVKCLTPGERERETVHQIIYNGLCAGTISEASRGRIAGIIAELAGAGAQGVVLGCTELPLLIRDEDVSIPVFDTLELHVQAAVRRALTP